jgi:hypothetical protein
MNNVIENKYINIENKMENPQIKKFGMVKIPKMKTDFTNKPNIKFTEETTNEL